MSLVIFSVVPPTEPRALRSTEPLKVSTRDFSWGNGGWCVWTSRKSGVLTYPEPLGSPRPVAGDLLSLPFTLFHCRSLCSSCLRRRSAAARLLRLWIRIPPRAWMFVVSVVCCQVEVSVMSWSLVQRSPTDCDVSCVIYKSREWGGPGPLGAVAPKTNTLFH